MYHNIVVKGESLPPTQIVPVKLQREVLGLLMDVLDPENLALPDALLAQLTPHPGVNLEDMSADYALALPQQRCYRMVVVASREMLPAATPATMLPSQPRRPHGHQDDTHGAG